MFFYLPYTHKMALSTYFIIEKQYGSELMVTWRDFLINADVISTAKKWNKVDCNTFNALNHNSKYIKHR